MHGFRRGFFWLCAEESLSNTYRHATQGQAALFGLLTALTIFEVLPFSFFALHPSLFARRLCRTLGMSVIYKRRHKLYFSALTAM